MIGKNEFFNENTDIFVRDRKEWFFQWKYRFGLLEIGVNDFSIKIQIWFLYKIKEMFTYKKIRSKFVWKI